MGFSDVIFKRRSIRKYDRRPVSRDMLVDIVRAGMNAPSAGNEQPWEFMVVDQPEILEKIGRVHPNAKMVPGSGGAILVCGVPGRQKYEGYWPQDCAAAVQNMLLYATDYGLGTVWIGIYPRKQIEDTIRKEFSLPNEVVPFAFVAVGYAAEEKRHNQRFREEWIYFNQWG